MQVAIGAATPEAAATLAEVVVREMSERRPSREHTDRAVRIVTSPSPKSPQTSAASGPSFVDPFPNSSDVRDSDSGRHSSASGAGDEQLSSSQRRGRSRFRAPAMGAFGRRMRALTLHFPKRPRLLSRRGKSEGALGELPKGPHNREARAHLAEHRAEAAEARAEALRRQLSHARGGLIENQDDAASRRVRELQGRVRELEAALLACRCEADERERALSHAHEAQRLAKAGKLLGISAAPSRTSIAGGNSGHSSAGAYVRRKFLRSLDEIVGPADPSRWVDEFRDLLLMQDATVSHSKVTAEHQMHLDKSSDELLHYYRYEYGHGYYERQIQGMLHNGWSEADAVPVRLLPAFGAAAMSNALTHFDATLAASCHMVAKGIALRAEAVEQVAPPLYISMVGMPAIGAYGLMDRDPSAAQLGARKRSGGRATAVSFAAPLILGDDPSLISEAGYSVYDGSHDAYRLTKGDMVCLTSAPNQPTSMHTAVLTNSQSQVPRWALPPNTLLTVAEIRQPPFEATFMRWHTFVDGGGTRMIVDRKELVPIGQKTCPTMYKLLADGRFELVTRGHPRQGEIYDDIGWHALNGITSAPEAAPTPPTSPKHGMGGGVPSGPETFSITVKSRRLIICRVTYSLPSSDGLQLQAFNRGNSTDSEGGSTPGDRQLVTREKLGRAASVVESARVTREAEERMADLNRASSREGSITAAPMAMNKWSVTTATLSFLYREAYTRGIEELALGLDHAMEDEWLKEGELSWVHWTGHQTSTREEYEYVMGVAKKDYNYVGRDVNNDGVSLDDFVEMLNSWLRMRHVVNDEQRNSDGNETANQALATGMPRNLTRGREQAREVPGSVTLASSTPQRRPSDPRNRRVSTITAGGARKISTLLKDGEDNKFLTREEVIAVRLYTGPGYAPINGWLREVANLPEEPTGGQARWGAWSEERAEMSAGEARRHAALDPRSSMGATVGHLVSAVRKIAAANTPEENERKLYRGLEGALPGRLWLPDDLGIVCVTDTAFMSTSLEEATSIFYLTKPHAGRTRGVGLLWELQAGSEDDTAFHCGADVSLLSQFGVEKEVLFPPLTMLRCIQRDKADMLKTDDPANNAHTRSALNRAHFLTNVPGEKARREKLTCMWRAVADLLLHARMVTERTKAMHCVTNERTENGHPYVRIAVQPNFTGIDVGDGADLELSSVD